MPTENRPTPRRARAVTPLSVALAAEIRAEAARHRITNAELQRRTKIAKNVLGQIMDGTKAPDVVQLALIANALEVPLVDLFSAAEDEVRRQSADPGRQASGG